MVFLCQKLKARFGQDFQPFGAGANCFIYGSSSGSGSTTNPNYGSGSDSGSEKNAWLRGSELRLRLRLPSPGCYNLYLIKYVILTEENYAFDQKNRLQLYIQAILPTVAYIVFKQERRYWGSTFSTPLRQHLSTHTHTNKLMLRRST